MTLLGAIGDDFKVYELIFSLICCRSRYELAGVRLADNIRVSLRAAAGCWKPETSFDVIHINFGDVVAKRSIDIFLHLYSNIIVSKQLLLRYDYTIIISLVSLISIALC